jgi:DNA-binding NtrC family response regulator
MTMGASRILVVDDEQEVCQMTARLLEKEGLIPLQAYDGKSALQKVRLESPEVVLTDKVLPDVDGLDLLRRMKDLDEDLPVVVMTGHAGITGAVEAIHAAAHDYLQKPFQARDLLCIIRRALV